jgi:hypothetical protein
VHRRRCIEIAETLKISKERVGYIVHECLDRQMLCVKWLPCVLTIDQNQQHVDDSEQCLAIFNRNEYEFFHRHITMDVTWLLHNTPESNQQSVEWTERKEPNTKRGKTQRSAGISIMGCAWYYIQLFIDYLEKGQTTNSEYYMALLERLNDEI